MGRPVRGDLAMTGEITLSGRVLPVGGIKEKVLAARRVGLREVILPRQNEKNINEDISEDLRRGLKVHFVTTIDEVLALALPAKARSRRRAPGPARRKR
jgi:ATP-dependent Lon protease